MIGTNVATHPKPSIPWWNTLTPAKFLFAVLVIQGVLLLSAHYRWFWFNERKGYTVLIAVAATAIAFLLLVAAVLVSQLFKSKTQFGLATLLLLVPVLAIPCGWLARELDLARQQRLIAEEFKSHLGAYAVEYTNQPPIFSDAEYEPRLVRQCLNPLLGTDYFDDAVSVWIERGDDRILERVRGFTELQQLFVDDGWITDDGLKHLQGLKKLHTLQIAQREDSEPPLITDAGLECLTELPQLRTFHLCRTNTTDEGIKAIGRLKQLTTLHLDESPKITDAGLKELNKLIYLQDLGLEHTSLTGAGFKELKGLTSLEKVWISNTPLSDAGLEHLVGYSRLRFLDVCATQVTDEGLQRFREALPKCWVNREPFGGILSK